MENPGEQIASLTAEVRGMNRRLENVENMHDTLNNMAVAMARLTERQESTEKIVENIAEDVNAIKQKPEKRMDAAATAVIAAVVSALVGFMSRLFVS